MCSLAKFYPIYIKKIAVFDNKITISFISSCFMFCKNESTLRKAITYGKLVNGVDVYKFGKQWVVSIDAMKREYGNGHERV